MGTLQKIDITEELVWKVAKVEYGKYNHGSLCAQSERVKGIWYDGVVDDFNTFNQLIDIFKECGVQCR